jgi:hypothetical protein
MFPRRMLRRTSVLSNGNYYIRHQDGTIVLIEDAAHSMIPSLGEGRNNNALESAVRLELIRVSSVMNENGESAIQYNTT